MMKPTSEGCRRSECKFFIESGKWDVPPRCAVVDKIPGTLAECPKDVAVVALMAYRTVELGGVEYALKVNVVDLI